MILCEPFRCPCRSCCRTNLLCQFLLSIGMGANLDTCSKSPQFPKLPARKNPQRRDAQPSLDSRQMAYRNSYSSSNRVVADEPMSRICFEVAAIRRFCIAEVPMLSKVGTGSLREFVQQIECYRQSWPSTIPILLVSMLSHHLVHLPS